MRAIHPPGSEKKAGSGPEEGSRPILKVKTKISRTASQKEGIARKTMEMTRITWSGHLSR